VTRLTHRELEIGETFEIFDFLMDRLAEHASDGGQKDPELIFRFLDGDETGMVSFKNLARGWQIAGMEGDYGEPCQAICDEFDTDGDGELSLDEFLSAFKLSDINALPDDMEDDLNYVEGMYNAAYGNEGGEDMQKESIKQEIIEFLEAWEKSDRCLQWRGGPERYSTRLPDPPYRQDLDFSEESTRRMCLPWSTPAYVFEGLQPGSPNGRFSELDTIYEWMEFSDFQATDMCEACPGEGFTPPVGGEVLVREYRDLIADRWQDCFLSITIPDGEEGMQRLLEQFFEMYDGKMAPNDVDDPAGEKCMLRTKEAEACFRELVAKYAMDLEEVAEITSAQKWQDAYPLESGEEGVGLDAFGALWQNGISSASRQCFIQVWLNNVYPDYSFCASIMSEDWLYEQLVIWREELDTYVEGDEEAIADAFKNPGNPGRKGFQPHIEAQLDLARGVFASYMRFEDAPDEDFRSDITMSAHNAFWFNLVDGEFSHYAKMRTEFQDTHPNLLQFDEEEDMMDEM